MLHAIGIPVIMFSVGGAAALISQADGVLKSGMLLGLIAGILIGRYDLKCWLVLTFFLIPSCIDHNPCAHLRRPMVMMCHG
jgi:hypothetical protein